MGTDSTSGRKKSKSEAIIWTLLYLALGGFLNIFLKKTREALEDKFEYCVGLSKKKYWSVLERALRQKRVAIMALVYSGIPYPLSLDKRM